VAQWFNHQWLDIETVVAHWFKAETRSVRSRSCASRNSLIKATPQGRGVLESFVLFPTPLVHFYPHPVYTPGAPESGWPRLVYVPRDSCPGWTSWTLIRYHQVHRVFCLYERINACGYIDYITTYGNAAKLCGNSATQGDYLVLKGELQSWCCNTHTLYEILYGHT